MFQGMSEFTRDSMSFTIFVRAVSSSVISILSRSASVTESCSPAEFEPPGLIATSFLLWKKSVRYVSGVPVSRNPRM